MWKLYVRLNRTGKAKGSGFAKPDDRLVFGEEWQPNSAAFSIDFGHNEYRAARCASAFDMDLLRFNCRGRLREGPCAEAHQQRNGPAEFHRAIATSFVFCVYCLVSSGCWAFSKNSFCSLRLSSSALMDLMAWAIWLDHAFWSNSPNCLVAAEPTPE